MNRKLATVLALTALLVFLPVSGSKAQEAKTEKPTGSKAMIEVDYTNYELMVQDCPTVMAQFDARKDELALHYMTQSSQELEKSRAICRSQEKTAKYPPPRSTNRDRANYEKERRAATTKAPRCDKGIFSKDKGKCI